MLEAWERRRSASSSVRECSMLATTVTEESIIRLVDGFYAKVRRDARLGPVFAAAIAEDEWPAHLAKMYDFWSSVMLTTGRYKGNPMAAHAAVPGIEPGLFAQWLALFGETADELFAPEIASVFRQKAARIAESLQLGLFYRPQTGLNLRPAGDR